MLSDPALLVTRLQQRHLFGSFATASQRFASMGFTSMVQGISSGLRYSLEFLTLSITAAYMFSHSGGRSILCSPRLVVLAGRDDLEVSRVSFQARGSWLHVFQ